MHQIQIHHRHFIYNDHICLQWILPISQKSACTLLLWISIHFQQSVDRLCLISGCLSHTLCRTSRRSRQKNAQSLALEKLDHCIDRRSLSCSRTSGQDQKSMLDRLDHRFMLQRIKFYLFLFFHSSQSFFHHIFWHLAINIKIVEHFCRIQFHIIIMCRIDNHFSVFLFHHGLPLHAQIHNILFNIFYFNSKQNLCPA